MAIDLAKFPVTGKTGKQPVQLGRLPKYKEVPDRQINPILY